MLTAKWRKGLMIWLGVLGLAGCSGSTGGSGGSSGNGSDPCTPVNGIDPCGVNNPNPDKSSPSALAEKLGLPNQFAFGYGYGVGKQGVDPFEGEFALGTSLQIVENYLTGDSWVTWESDDKGNGAFATRFSARAYQNNAIPMLTYYCARGFFAEGAYNESDTQAYFNGFRIMLKRIADLGKPVLVHIEPDMIGFAQQYANAQAPNYDAGDPTVVRIQLGAVEECSGMPNDMTGYAKCVLHMRDLYASGGQDASGNTLGTALIGFSPSLWGYPVEDVIAFAVKMGVQNGDFIVMETLDRDVGCYELQMDGAYQCVKQPSPAYWTDADFAAHFENAKKSHEAYQLPLIWWQTPLGVDSDQSGWNPWVKTYYQNRSEYQYGFRDNRMKYFFEHLDQLANVGGLAVIFGSGGQQTDLATDIMDASGTHQFKTYLTAYNTKPLVLTQ